MIARASLVMVGLLLASSVLLRAQGGCYICSFQYCVWTYSGGQSKLCYQHYDPDECVLEQRDPCEPELTYLAPDGTIRVAALPAVAPSGRTDHAVLAEAGVKVLQLCQRATITLSVASPERASELRRITRALRV